MRFDRSWRALRSASFSRAATASGLSVSRRLAALGGHDGVHQPQALERVTRVMHFAFVDLGEIVLHVAAGQRRTAEQHRELLGDPAGVHLLQVLLHHHRRLHQQPGHPDHVGALVLGHFEDGGDRLLDADVDDLVAVVGQDDVDEVLADVVHVALDGGQHDAALAAVVVGLLHVRFEVGHRGLHHLGGLQHERQLHLAGAEQLADGLHARQQVLVDDGQRRLLRSSPRRGRPPGRCVRRRRCAAPAAPAAAAWPVLRRGTPSTRPPTRPRTSP